MRELKFSTTVFIKRINIKKIMQEVAIAIKRDLIHQVLDDFEEDVLAVKIDTTKGPIIVSMAYRPPRVIDFPLADVLKLLRKNMPVYISADLNARHRTLGHNNINEAGTIVNNLLKRDLAGFCEA